MRDREFGNRYIQAIAFVFSKLSAKYHFEDLMTKVSFSNHYHCENMHIFELMPLEEKIKRGQNAL